MPQRRPTVWWRIGHSLWLLAPLIGCGGLGGLALTFLGLYARRPSWWIPGLVYTAGTIAAFVVVGVEEIESTLSDAAAGVLLALWVACLFHCLLINSSWLRWSFHHQPWHQQFTTLQPWQSGPAYPQPYQPPHPPQYRVSEQSSYPQPWQVPGPSEHSQWQVPGWPNGR